MKYRDILLTDQTPNQKTEDYTRAGTAVATEDREKKDFRCLMRTPLMLITETNKS